MKKYILSSLTVVLFAIGFVASDSKDNNKVRCGAYEVTDVNGNTLLFQLNEDETVTAHFKNDDNIYYGHADYYVDENLGMHLEFSQDTPILYFEAGVNDRQGFFFTPDEFLYPYNRDLVDAKNPRCRLKVKRTK